MKEYHLNINDEYKSLINKLLITFIYYAKEDEVLSDSGIIEYFESMKEHIKSNDWITVVEDGSDEYQGVGETR